MMNAMIEVSTREYNGHKIATAFHDGLSKDIVIFCHGFRGDSIGPKRFFVRVANKLAVHGVSSLRFDQCGSGNSDGDFYDSSFNDWIATTRTIADNYLKKGYRVSLVGQSMGGATAIAAASQLPEISALVAWVPDPNVDPFSWPQEGYIEEGGQRIQASYWQEAHDARVAVKLKNVKAPALIVQCTDDEYVDSENREALLTNAQSNHKVIVLDGFTHSGWSYEQAELVINDSVDFLIKTLGK